MDGKFLHSVQRPSDAEDEDRQNLTAEADESGTHDGASKRDRFRRLAESRTNKALSAIAIIGNLSNRHVYEYDEAEVKKIVRALRDQISAVEERFSAPKTRPGARFKL